jgi:hypothetical protein
MSNQLILSEHQEQVSFVTEVKLQYRNDPEFIEPLFFSTLNGAWLGGNSHALWNKHRAEGAQKGVSDILYLQPRGGFHFLAIEMKRSDRRNDERAGLTPDEQEWLAAAMHSGAFTAVCYTAEEAFEVFKHYMNMEAP